MTDEPTYFQKVDAAWYEFTRHRLSPLDWAEVAAWSEAGIPLVAVLAGMEITFQNLRRSPRPAKVRSITYCAPEVYDAWEEFSRAEVQTSGVPKISPLFETGK
jgi:hypothetical protein